jgi:polycystin 1L2
MSTAVKINNPTAIKIWHDNRGSGNDASWYLSKIVMEDIQTNEK